MPRRVLPKTTALGRCRRDISMDTSLGVFTFPLLYCLLLLYAALHIIPSPIYCLCTFSAAPSLFVLGPGVTWPHQAIAPSRLTQYGACLHFYRENASSSFYFLVDSRRTAHTHPVMDARFLLVIFICSYSNRRSLVWGARAR